MPACLSIGEAAGNAAVEADYVDPAAGRDLLGVDAYRLADRGRLRHPWFWALALSQQISLSTGGPVKRQRGAVFCLP